MSLCSGRRCGLIRVGLLISAASMLSSGAALAAEPAGVIPDAKRSTAALTVRPDRYDFRDVIVTLDSAPLTVTATNDSRSVSIDFTRIVASAPFAIQSDVCSGSPLAPGDSCEVTVVFHPVSAGRADDKKALTFADSAKNSPQHVRLEGRGITGPTPTPPATPTRTPTPPTPTPTPTPTPAWLELPSMKLSLYGLAALGPKAELFAAGGFIPGSGASEAVYACLACTPSSGGWEGKLPMPSPQAFPAYANNYVAGGDDGSGPVATLVAGGFTWETLAPMPTARSAPAGAFDAGLFYVMGGNTGSAVTGVLEVYNPSSNSWTSAAPMITPRSDLGADAIGGIIYAAGGMDASSAALATLEAYNPATNSWTAQAPMLTPRADLAVVAFNGLLYAVGGRGADGNPLASVEAYNPATNIWTAQLPMPTARWGLAGIVGPENEVLYLSGTSPMGIWAIGGAIDAAGDTATSAVEVFIP